MKKTVFPIIGILVLALVWFFYSMFVLNNSATANPDYICIKSVSDQPCSFNPNTDCSAWSDWKRTCTWKKTTKVAYFLIRTDCEAWYTKKSRGNSGWSSWRQWADYSYQSETCTVIQQDTIAPAWEWQALY